MDTVSNLTSLVMQLIPITLSLYPHPTELRYGDVIDAYFTHFYFYICISTFLAFCFRIILFHSRIIYLINVSIILFLFFLCFALHISFLFLFRIVYLFSIKFSILFHITHTFTNCHDSSSMWRVITEENIHDSSSMWRVVKEGKVHESSACNDSWQREFII